MNTASLYENHYNDSLDFAMRKTQQQDIRVSPEPAVIVAQGNADSLRRVSNCITVQTNQEPFQKVEMRSAKPNAMSEKVS